MLIAHDGVVKVGDYCIMTGMESSLYLTTTMRNALWYMAPEVFDGEMELKSDIWSFGVSLVELAEGKNPYLGSSTIKSGSLSGMNSR